tara:strand:+ start:428 stop:682 length:255 start_codon:yes stop_codon:yes gene_type:complete
MTLRIESGSNGSIEIYEYDDSTTPPTTTRVSAPREMLNAKLPRDVRKRVHELSGEMYKLTQPDAPSQPCTEVTSDVKGNGSIHF